MYAECAEPNSGEVTRSRTNVNRGYGLTAGPPPVVFAPRVRARGCARFKEKPESREDYARLKEERYVLEGSFHD